MAPTSFKSRTDSVVSASSIHSDKAKEKGNMLGYLFAFLVIICYTVAVVSAQLAVDSIPMFQVSLMRYSTQLIVAISTVGFCRKKITIETKKIWMVATLAAFDYAYNYSIYKAASYLPVGNLEGIFTALTIVILGGYDIFRKKCGINGIVSGVVCASGLLLLVQPWNIVNEVKTVTNKTIPCEMFGNVGSDISPFDVLDNSSTTDAYESSSVTSNTTTYTEILNITMTTETTSPYTNSTQNTTSGINDDWIGYVLIVSASVSMSVISVLIDKLTTDYHPAVLSFWIALIDGIISAILMLSLESPSLPNGTYCVIFAFLLSTLAALNAFFSHITLSYLLPSQTALVLSLSMVVLFIVQNTLLVNVQPGRGNIEEIIGAIVTFTGAIISPLYMLCSRLCKREQIYSVDSEK